MYSTKDWQCLTDNTGFYTISPRKGKWRDNTVEAGNFFCCTWSLLKRTILGSGTWSSLVAEAVLWLLLAVPARPSTSLLPPPPAIPFEGGSGFKMVYFDFWLGEREGTWKIQQMSRNFSKLFMVNKIRKGHPKLHLFDRIIIVDRNQHWLLKGWLNPGVQGFFGTWTMKMIHNQTF